MPLVTDTLLLLAVGGAGAVGGHCLRLPFGALLGALVAVGGLELATGAAATLHGPWQLVAQVLIGSALGSQLRPEALRTFRRTLLPSSLTVAVTVAVGFGLGWLVFAASKLDPSTALFGMMPGGVGQMTAAAAAAGGVGSLVTMMGLVRLVAVIGALSFLLRRTSRPAEGMRLGDEDDVVERDPHHPDDG